MTRLEAAIEAGASAWFARQQATRRDDGRWRFEDVPAIPYPEWEHLTEDDKRAYRALVEPIVRAALADPEGVGR